MYLDILNKKVWSHHETDLVKPGLQNDELDCGSKDSGNDDCWPTWVNVTVPIICVLSLVAVLILLYVFKPRAPESLQRQRTQNKQQGEGHYKHNINSPSSQRYELDVNSATGCDVIQNGSANTGSGVIQNGSAITGIRNAAMEFTSTDNMDDNTITDL